MKDTYHFNFAGEPNELVALFTTYYGPTMNAYEAADANGRAAELKHELEALFDEQNVSDRKGATSHSGDVPARDRGRVKPRRTGSGLLHH